MTPWCTKDPGECYRRNDTMIPRTCCTGVDQSNYIANANPECYRDVKGKYNEMVKTLDQSIFLLQGIHFLNSVIQKSSFNLVNSIEYIYKIIEKWKQRQDKTNEYPDRSILNSKLNILHYYWGFFHNLIFFNLQGCYDAVKDLISTYGNVFIAISIVVMVVEVKW